MRDNYQKRQKQKELMDHQNELYKEKIFHQQTKQYDPTKLPAWVGNGTVDRYFSESTEGQEGHLSTCLDGGLYERFLCDVASNAVFECLGFKEVVQTLVPAASKKLYARMRDTAPVFSQLELSGLWIDLGGGFVKHIGGGKVFAADKLFAWKNPLGLRSVTIKFSKALAEWMDAVPWEQLRKYLGQSCVKWDPDRKFNVYLGPSTDDVESVVGSSAPKNDAPNKMKQLFSSLVPCTKMVVEASPFVVDIEFIRELPRMIQDLLLFGDNTRWNKDFLQSIKGHFGSLRKLGLPAGCLNVPLLVATIENSVDELTIKNVDDRQRLNPQDLAMLFERFQAVELDSSLISTFPSTRNKVKLTSLTLRADRQNFFIQLLLALPSSVRTLRICNVTFSSNILMLDVSQIQKFKFNTRFVDTLVMECFADNLDQLWKVLKHDLFPNLKRLLIVITANERAAQNVRGKQEEIRRVQADILDKSRSKRLQIDTRLETKH